MNRMNNVWLLSEYWDSEVSNESGMIVFPKGYGMQDLRNDQEEYSIGMVRVDMTIETRYGNRISLFMYDDIKTNEDWYRLSGMDFSFMMFPIEFMVERSTLWHYLLSRFHVTESKHGLSILY